MNDTTIQSISEADALANILQVQDTPVEGENKEVQKAEIETEEAEPQIETVETDEIELEAEADDNLFDEEFEADTEDVNDEETAVPLELSDDLEISYKSDGEMKKATLGELKRGRAGQDYIQRKMQDVAQLEKELRSEKSEYSNKTQRILELGQQMQEAPLVTPIPPSDELFETDPVGFMRAKMTYDKEVGEYNNKVNKLQELHTERQKEQEVQLQQYTNDQTKILMEKLPELANPEKEAAYKAKLLKAGEHYGFKAEELQMVRDHRYVLTLNDAMKYRALVNKRKAANTKAGKTTTPTVKAGVKKRPGSIKSKQQDQALQRLKQSGKAEDAISLLLNN